MKIHEKAASELAVLYEDIVNETGTADDIASIE